MSAIMTETSAKPENWGKLKSQVKSWIDVDQHCVTAQKISQSLDISRKEGSELLNEILQENPKHQITTCEKIQDGNTTVFRLRTTTSKADDSSASIFALSALETTESVATAHERDMVHWREIVADQSYQQSIVSAIAPAEELQDGEHAKPISRAVDFEESSSTTPSKATVIRPGKLNAKPKAMSASSFFGGKKKEATKSSTVGVTEKKKVTAVNSKENRQNTIKKSQVAPVPVKVGNADDFVADEEDSDDEEIKVVKKPAAAARVPKVKASSPAPSAPKPKSSPVRGAMDAFAEERPDIKRQRKRRKKLVEKTTMVGGYLRTETVTVWEDIPTDEENEEEEKKKLIKTKAAAISKPKKPENMKQKNMMSFFAPRK